MVDPAAFAPWLAAWGLEADGTPFQTPFTKSLLMAVRQRGRPAMLKLARTEQERLGAEVIAWWDGLGSAAVLAQQGEALLLERAQGDGDLCAMARDGHDDAATNILCAALSRLHAPRATPPPRGLQTLTELFAALDRQAGADTRIGRCQAQARPLLADQHDVLVLHGDMHHANVLDFGPRGWLAIDPWGVVGERAYDFANILRNPDLACALRPGRFRRQVAQISVACNLDPQRLAGWSVAHAGLSAAWQIEDGEDPAPNLAIIDAFCAQMAA